MKYQRLGDSDLEVSTVGMGTWAIGGDFWGGVDDKRSVKAIRRGIESGINLIDTAPNYGGGHSEEVVGEAIDGYRDDVVLVTKCGVYKEDGEFVRDPKPEVVRRQIDESLDRLGVDVIDLYLIHWPIEGMPLEETVAELERIRDSGKVRHIGVSNFDAGWLSRVTDLTDVTALEFQYSILNRDIEEGTLSACRKNDIGVLTYGTLGGGILTGKYMDEPPKLEEGDQRGKFYPFFQEPHWGRTVELVEVLEQIAEKRGVPTSQVAINWVRQQSGVTSTLVGVKTPEQAEENAGAMDWELSGREMEEIDSAYDNIFE